MAKFRMESITEILKELEAFGSDGVKNIFIKHGAQEPFFGVKVGDLKKIQKRIKKNHQLALDLYATGNSDAMYLAGLIADEKVMTKGDLQDWVKEAYWYMISEYTVPWITSETPFAMELGLEWIESKIETTAACGWATLSSYASIKPDSEIDINLYSKLLDRVLNQIDKAQNRERYVMNGFVISVGCYIESLSEKALEIGRKIGKVQVEMGGTACKVPSAPDYILKVVNKGYLGKKRKEARC